MTDGARGGGRGALPPPPEEGNAAGRSPAALTPAEARAAPWAERWPPPPGAAAAAAAEAEAGGSVLRLLAVPWAGAGASAYAGWAAHLGPDVELWAVRPPGREGRAEAEEEADLRALAAAAAAALAPLLAEKPYALFGHGTGAWVAFALLRALVAAGAPPPLAFFASNFPSPFVDRAEFLPDLPAALGDRRAAAAALRPFGLPATLFEPTLWETFGGAVRREYGLLEGLEPPGDDGGDDAAAGGGKLPCRFRAFLSQDDPVVGPKAGNPELMEGWGRLSTHKHMAVDVFQGDHFYLCDPDVGDAVAKAVGGYCQALADELTFEL